MGTFVMMSFSCLHLSLPLPVFSSDVGLGWGYSKHKEWHLVLSEYELVFSCLGKVSPD